MHWHHLPFAIFLSLTAGSLVLLAKVRQVDRIIRIAIKRYREVRDLLGPFDGPEGIQLLRRVLNLTRHNLPAAPSRSSAATAGECLSPCCTSGGYPWACKREFEMSLLAAQCILEAGRERVPAQHVKIVNGSWRKIHRNWLFEYRYLTESHFRAELIRTLLVEFNRGYRNRKRRHRLVAAIGARLAADGTGKFVAARPSRHSLGAAEIATYNIISGVILRLQENECAPFLYKFFAQITEAEIARRTRSRTRTVKARTRKSFRILDTLIWAEASKDLELMATLIAAFQRWGSGPR